MSANPFDDDSSFASSSSSSSRASAPTASARSSRMSVAEQVASRNSISSSGSGGLSADQAAKAGRIYAASAAAAARDEVEGEESKRRGSTARQSGEFLARDRTASMILSQQAANGIGQKQRGASGAFPMTELVDAQNDKKLGLSFATLAMREGIDRHGRNASHDSDDSHDEGSAPASRPAVAPRPSAAVQAQSSKPARATKPSSDPWNHAMSTPLPPTVYGSASPPGVAHKRASTSTSPAVPQSSQQLSQPRAPLRDDINVDMFDPLNDGPKMSMSAAGIVAPVAGKKRAKKAAKVESSDDESSDDEQDEAALAAAARAKKSEAKKKAAAAAALALQREVDRAEAVAYDETRKKSIISARNIESARQQQLQEQQQQQHRSSTSSSSNPHGFKSRAIDPDDDDVLDVQSNSNPSSQPSSGRNLSYSPAVISRWGANPADHWAYSKSRTRSKLMMPKVCVYWRLVWMGVKHEVELFHSTISGKRTVRADGALVAQEKMFLDTGSRHDFHIGSGAHPCPLTVLICSSGSDYAYELFINKKRFYQALQSWMIELQNDKSK